MSFFSKLFGAPSAETAETAERNAERDFNTLRDDGVRAMRAGQIEYAERCFEHALLLHPDDLTVVSYLAEALLRRGEYEKALPHLTQLVGAEAGGIEVRLLLAQAQGGTGRYAEERATAEAIAAEFPDEPRAAYLLGEAAHGLSDPFTAIASLTKALTLREDYAAARLLRARVLAEMGQWNEVLADTALLCDPAVSAPADESRLLHADALSAVGRDDEAEAAYRDALAANPFFDEALLHLGAHYERTSRFDLALSLYDEAIAERPDFAEAYRSRGGVKLRLHDEAGAADDLKRSLELRPEQAAALQGEFTNLQDSINEQYRAANPYRF